MKIHSIQIRNKALNPYLAKFLIIPLRRIAEMSSYGDQISSRELPDKKILLPVNEHQEPDYDFMESYILKKEKEKLTEYYKYIEKQTKEIKLYEVTPLSNKQWKEFSIESIFQEIQRGKRLKTANHIAGSFPYVSSTKRNNGVDAFVGNTNNVRMFSNCLSLANSGSVGSCFYQPFEFVASDHVTKLKSSNANKYTYIFISILASRLGAKYSFNLEMSDTRIKREKILLPVNEHQEPDYLYMQNFVKQLKYRQLLLYLKYKKLKIM